MTAPTIPRTTPSATPAPDLLTSLLPMNPAISPNTIEARSDTNQAAQHGTALPESFPPTINTLRNFAGAWMVGASFCRFSGGL